MRSPSRAHRHRRRSRPPIRSFSPHSDFASEFSVDRSAPARLVRSLAHASFVWRDLMFHVLIGATVLVAALLAPPANAAPLTFQAALDRAVQRSETARASRSSLLSASEAAQAAAQLPDPMLRVGVDNLPVTGPDRFSTTREPMTMKRIGVSQESLSRDKRDARQAAADAVVGKEQVQTQIAAAEARLRTALAYVDASYAEQTLKLATMMEHHAHEQYEAARSRLASAT